MTNPTPFSPAAQAVLDALPSAPHLQMVNRAYAAAALRAAVECYAEEGNGEGPQWFLAIAAELEGAHDDPS